VVTAALSVLSPSSLEYIVVSDAGCPVTAGTCPLPKLLGACAGAGAGAGGAGATGAFGPLTKLLGACGARMDSHVTHAGRKRGASKRASLHPHATPRPGRKKGNKHRDKHACVRPPVRALARKPATREPALRHRHPSARCSAVRGDHGRFSEYGVPRVRLCGTFELLQARPNQ